MSAVVNFLSGEFFLKSRPNGGTAVLLRSIWVTILICLCVLPLKSYFAKNTTLAFSAEQLKIELGELIPWFGAIFAGAYAAFYSRFAAQWSYLANLYNQIMATCTTAPPGLIPNQTLVYWHAAFVEDAQDLHLAGKSMFSEVVRQFLQDPYVVQAFLASTNGGPNRLRDLERALNFVAAAPSAIDFETSESLKKAVVAAADQPVSNSSSKDSVTK